MLKRHFPVHAVALFSLTFPNRASNMWIKREECGEIVRAYDTSRSYSLYYPDFLSVVLPKERAQLTSNALDRKVLKANTRVKLPFQVRNKLAELLKKEWELVKELQNLHEKLRNRPKFGVYHLFRSMDLEDSHYLTLEAIHKFMRKQEAKLNLEEIKAVLRRFDSDQDGKVSYLDFEYAICGGEEKVSLKEPTTEQRGRRVTTPYRPKYYSPQPKRENLVKMMDGKYSPGKLSTREGSPIVLRKSRYEDIMEEEEKSDSLIKLQSTPPAEEQSENPSVVLSSPGTAPKVLIPHELPEPVEEPVCETPLRPAEALSPGLAECPTSAQSPEARYIDYSPTKLEMTFMKNPEWERKLARIFKSQIAIDTELEETKIELCNKPDFSIETAFNYFDKKGIGSISMYELREGLEKLGIKSNTEGLLLLMRRYDLDTDGSLNFEEFEKMITPCKEVALGTSKDYFVKETKDAFIETFKGLVKMEVMAESIRKKVREIACNLQETFVGCDENLKGFLTKKDILEFMKQNKTEISELDAELLMSRYDKDMDQKVTLKEVK